MSITSSQFHLFLFGRVAVVQMGRVYAWNEEFVESIFFVFKLELDVFDLSF